MSEARVTGVVHFVDEVKTYGQSGFRKRLVVLEQANERFTNYVPVEFVYEGCDDSASLKVGDEVEIQYRLTGRKWQRDANSEVKYFLNAEATGFQVLSGGSEAAAAEKPTDSATANDAFSEAAGEDDEIPF